MKRALLTLSTIIFTILAASAAPKKIVVKVTNPGETRRSVPVVISVDKKVRTAVVTLFDKEIPCQLDDLNDDGIYDELCFLTDIGKKETLEFKVTLDTEGTQTIYKPLLTYGYLGIRDRDKSAKKPSHQEITSVTFPASTNPYNYIFPHGAVMENDMVGFRVYCDHRQSIDYYGHRTRKLDIAETGFYPTPEQKAEGSGDDVLYTGSTYGCGALHAWDAEKRWSVMFEKCRNHTQTIVTQGPIRTIVDITNKEWQPFSDKKPVDITTRYTLYAGHRDVQVDVKFSRNVADIPLSTGIVDIVEGSEAFSDKAGLRGCWGTACAGNNPKVYDTHTVGLGICVPKKYYKEDSYFSDRKESLPNQAYVEIIGTRTNNLHYWFTVTCDMETFGFNSKEAWFKYLREWKKELASDVKISVSKEKKPKKTDETK